MKIDCKSSDLDFTKVLGRRDTTNGPLLVRFVSYNKKIEILRNRKSLQNTEIYINEDLTKETRDRRKDLKPVLIHFKNQGKKYRSEGISYSLKELYLKANRRTYK